MLDVLSHLFQGEETPLASSYLRCSPPALSALEELCGTVSQATLTTLSVAERTSGSFTLNFTTSQPSLLKALALCPGTRTLMLPLAKRKGMMLGQLTTWKASDQ